MDRGAHESMNYRRFWESADKYADESEGYSWAMKMSSDGVLGSYCG